MRRHGGIRWRRDLARVLIAGYGACAVGVACAAPEPFVHTHPVADGRLLLVMHSPMLSTNDAWAMKRLSDEQKRLLSTYRQSGLYPADGTTNAVWTLPSAWHYFVADDGVHVVHSSPDDSCAEFVITFFASGKQIRSYRADDLVSAPRETIFRLWQFLTGSDDSIVSGATDERPWRLAEKFDAEALTYTLQTVHGDAYVFDVRSGAVNRAAKPLRTTLVVILLPLLLLIGIVFAVCVVRSIRRARA